MGDIFNLMKSKNLSGFSFVFSAFKRGFSKDSLPTSGLGKYSLFSPLFFLTFMYRFIKRYLF